MDPRAKLPDEVEIKQPSAEYVAAAAAIEPIVMPPEPKPEPVAPTAPAGGEGEEPEPLIDEEAKAPAPKVKRGKVASKRLKKVAKEVSQLGVDADVEPNGGDEA
jgi:hypothetical protein